MMSKRWLKNVDTGQIIVVTHDENHVGNGHALVDPTDPNAEPAAGWVESSLAEFESAIAQAKHDASLRAALDAKARSTASVKLASLGFTPAERRAMGL
jgi:hypothetical protein